MDVLWWTGKVPCIYVLVYYTYYIHIDMISGYLQHFIDEYFEEILNEAKSILLFLRSSKEPMYKCTCMLKASFPELKASLLSPLKRGAFGSTLRQLRDNPCHLPDSAMSEDAPDLLKKLVSLTRPDGWHR